MLIAHRIKRTCTLFPKPCLAHIVEFLEGRASGKIQVHACHSMRRFVPCLLKRERLMISVD